MVTTKDFDSLMVSSIEPKTISVSISEIVSKYQKGKIIIPKIQRGFVWDRNRALELIMSIIQGYPIPPLLTLKLGSEYFIIDGQQRLKTILWFMDVLNDEDKAEVENRLGKPRLSPSYVYGKYLEIGRELDYKKTKEMFSQKNIDVLKSWLEERPIEMKVIEIKDDKNLLNIMTDLFIRLNKNAVKVTNYEIIKAVLIKELEDYFAFLTSKLTETVPMYSTTNSREDYEKDIILLDGYVNGIKNDLLYDKKYLLIPYKGNVMSNSSIKVIAYHVLSDRALVKKGNKSEWFKMMSNLEEAVDTVMKYGEILYGSTDNLFKKVLFDNEKAFLRYSPIKDSSAFLFRAITIYELANLNKGLLISKPDEIVSEIEYRYLMLSAELKSSYVNYWAIFERLKKEANKLAHELSRNGGSRTFNNERRVPSEIRDNIFRAYTILKGKNPICPYCNREIKNPEDADVSHVKAKFNGGSNSLFNLTLAHKTCNRAFGVADIDL